MTADPGAVLDWRFWVWAIVGVGFGLVISVLGIFTVPASALAAIVLLRRPAFRESAYGALIGIGAVPLFVAYDNRKGPGTECHTIDRTMGTQCDQLLDPRPWLVAGVAFVAAGLVAQALRARRGRRV